MNKRGQFFLVAAIIIIGIVIALATTINTVRVRGSQNAFYDQGDEIKYESDRVLDYGVFNGNDIDSLLKEYLEEYANYISEEQVIFLYGDKNGMTALYFVIDSLGDIVIDTGGGTTGVPIQAVVGEIITANVVVNGDIVSVTISDVVYQFKLKQGQNFFFVIIKTEDGEKFVAQR